MRASSKAQRVCPECNDSLSVSRREFLAAGTAAVAAGSLGLAGAGRAFAAPTRKSAAESAVGRLYGSLTDAQRKIVALPWDDARRTKISANWSITDAAVANFSKEQQAIIHEILKGVTSEDGYGRIVEQTNQDWGGLENYAVAIFGDPAGEKFTFELTGRHLTLRADGDTAPGAAFGGPIIYGHGAKGNSSKNLFSYQTKRANEVFAALDGKQREKALLEKAPSETAVQVGAAKTLPGISCGELSADQRELVAKTLQDILKPYRKEDVDEVMEIVKAGGGMEKVQIAFYRSGDLDDDKSWYVWRLEGPTLVCHFRGAPHVHAYINVAQKAT